MMDCCTTAAQEQADTSANKPVVLIIGAGFGGLSTAKQLIKNGAASTKFRVIMVESKDYFSVGGMWQFVWNSRIEKMDTVRWPLKKAILPDIDLRLNTTVTEWLPDEKRVVLQGGKSLVYHAVVLACGAIADPSAIPGIENYSNICSEKHVIRQKEEMIALVKAAKDISPSSDEKLVFCLSIAVNPYKCPPAPYELIFLVDEYLRNADVRENVRVIITCPVDWTMPPNTMPIFMEAFEEKGIEFIPHKQLEKVEDKKVYFKDGSDALEFHTLWSVWPIRAPDFVKNAGGGVQINPKGTVTVGDKVTNTIPNLDDAYVIGDACAVPFGEKGGIPKAGEFAWQMGISVGNAINDDVKPAIRVGKCTAEAGFGKGFILRPNFSDVCNDPENGKPRVGIEATDEGSFKKVEWCNGYLQEIFGDRVKPVKLES